MIETVWVMSPTLTLNKGRPGGRFRRTPWLPVSLQQPQRED
jgi:hypothetical protein